MKSSGVRIKFRRPALKGASDGEETMPNTTHRVKAEIAQIDRLIFDIEAKPQEKRLAWSHLLEELREEREVLNLLILNRRVEAMKPVVDLRRWRDGPFA
jgi:hypothetical protein